MQTDASNTLHDYDWSSPRNSGLPDDSDIAPLSESVGSSTSEDWEHSQFSLPSIKFSTTFNYELTDDNGSTPDVQPISYEAVHFAVHAAKLRAVSRNDFSGLLSPLDFIALAPLTAAVLNLLLHAVYELDTAKYAPSIGDLATAVEALEQYGLSKEIHMSYTSTLFRATMSHAPSFPLECYKLAAHANIEELAVLVSPYTLRLSLSELTEEDVVCMGALYTKRLFFLHIGRVDAFKRILLPSPALHSFTNECDAVSQRRLSRAWTMTVAEMTWSPGPNLSVISLETRMGAIAKELDCPECVIKLQHRVERLLLDYSLIKRTI